MKKTIAMVFGALVMSLPVTPVASADLGDLIGGLIRHSVKRKCIAANASGRRFSAVRRHGRRARRAAIRKCRRQTIRFRLKRTCHIVKCKTTFRF